MNRFSSQRRSRCATGAAARLAPLRDWRRCATGAAARLAPLRVTILKLLPSLITLMLISPPLIGQLVPMNFGSEPGIDRVICPVIGFYKPLSGYYLVSVSVGGMVFDHQREYSLQLSTIAPVGQTVSSNDANHWGLYHTQWADNMAPPLFTGNYGNVKKINDTLLGAGVYDIRFTNNDHDVTIHLDLTDGSWLNGTNFRNIGFSPFPNGTDEVSVFISSTSNDQDSGAANLHCGDFSDGSTINYWYLARNLDPTYPRDRDDFSINPNYTGPFASGPPNSTDIPYGVKLARMDVHARVRDNIRIPAGKMWRVTTSSDPLLVSEETYVMFAENKGITVRDKGTLVSTHTDPYGVTEWFCYESTDKGAWTGITGERGSTIEMTSAYVTNAVAGLNVNRSNVTLDVVLIDSSRDRGMHIINCSPMVSTSLISNTGGVISPERGINVYITGAASAPVFNFTAITRARKTFPYQGGPESGGHGVEIFAADTALFNHCTVSINDSAGYFIHATNGPYILTNRIDSNQVGIFVQGGDYWTTLRDSRVFNNYRGLYLTGVANDTARIRGWYPPFKWIDPNTPDSTDRISDIHGLNCVYDNYENIRAQSVSRLDFGALYYNSGGVQVPLGHVNSIFDPGSGYQVLLYNYSVGGFQRNWWNGQNQLGVNFLVDASSSMDAGNELAADSIGCRMFGKSIADEGGSLTQDILLYRRTRGTMRLPEARVEASATSKPVGGARTMLLGAPYPNPFNPVTNVSVTLFEGQDIHLFVMDATGRQVIALASGYYEAGRYTVNFHSDAVPSGVYHLVLRGAHGVQTQRLVLTR
jgi:hypothetical protein